MITGLLELNLSSLVMVLQIRKAYKKRLLLIKSKMIKPSKMQ